MSGGLPGNTAVHPVHETPPAPLISYTSPPPLFRVDPNARQNARAPRGTARTAHAPPTAVSPAESGGLGAISFLPVQPFLLTEEIACIFPVPSYEQRNPVAPFCNSTDDLEDGFSAPVLTSGGTWISLRAATGDVRVALPDGTCVWLHHGKVHRSGDLPAVILGAGDVYYYQDNILHRDDDKPAVVSADGRMEWWTQGVCERFGGPAVVFPDGHEEWWVNGRKVHSLLTSSR